MVARISSKILFVLSNFEHFATLKRRLDPGVEHLALKTYIGDVPASEGIPKLFLLILQLCLVVCSRSFRVL